MKWSTNQRITISNQLSPKCNIIRKEGVSWFGMLSSHFPSFTLGWSVSGLSIQATLSSRNPSHLPWTSLIPAYLQIQNTMKSQRHSDINWCMRMEVLIGFLLKSSMVKKYTIDLLVSINQEFYFKYYYHSFIYSLLIFLNCQTVETNVRIKGGTLIRLHCYWQDDPEYSVIPLTYYEP